MVGVANVVGGACECSGQVCEVEHVDRLLPDVAAAEREKVTTNEDI